MENYLKHHMVKYNMITRATAINSITGPEGGGNKLMFNYRVAHSEKPFKRARIPYSTDSERENDESYSTEQTLLLGGNLSSTSGSSSSS